jgi:hypothetical protein
MTLAPVKPGGWGTEVLTSFHLSALQALIVQAIDGVNGGTYVLQDELVFDGAEVRFDSAARVLAGAFLYVANGGQLSLLAGSTTTVAGALNVASGGNLNLQNGAQLNVNSGGRIDVESGALINILNGSSAIVHETAFLDVEGTIEIQGFASIQVLDGAYIVVQTCADDSFDTGAYLRMLAGSRIIGSSGAEIKVNDADDFTINNSSTSFIVALNPIHVGAQWASEESGTFMCATVATSNRLVFPLEVPVGDTITTLRMIINGGVGAGHGGGAPTDRPILELCRVDANGTVTPIQTVVDPVDTGSYDNAHAVTMSGGLLPYVVTAHRHLVRVVGEGITGGITNTTRLCSIDGTSIARTVRQLTEIR